MLGIDKGTTYTKTDKGLIIRSIIRTFRENEVMLNNEKTLVEYEGEKYIVGEKGNYSTDLMKSEHKNTKILILTAIGLTYSDSYITTDIVTGLPIALYSKQKEKMKENLQKDTVHQIRINNQNKLIKLANIEVFPESAGAFYSQDKHQDGLVVDIGGLSIDIALFERRKLIKYSTYPMGIMKLYSKIANYINSQHDLALTEWDIENIVKEGLYLDGKKVDIDFSFLIREHIEEIMERLKLEYDLRTIRNILLTGGGSILLNRTIREQIPQATVLPNSQFSNVRGYANIGRVIFG